MHPSILIHNQEVYGINLNQQTGCLHYHSPVDIIAVLFKCCRRYYACYLCHVALADHAVNPWEPHEYGTQAILCGRCGKELTIHQYLSCHPHCLYCGSSFNPGCQTHWNIYFKTPMSLT
jgi:uncharacterized CHY-type Zn-finger protein